MLDEFLSNRFFGVEFIADSVFIIPLYKDAIELVKALPAEMFRKPLRESPTVSMRPVLHFEVFDRQDLRAIVSELTRAMLHMKGAFLMPYAALPVGAVFDSVDKGSYGGVFRKLNNLQAQTIGGSTTVHFDHDENVIYLKCEQVRFE